MGDNDIIKLGDSADGSIYSDGTNLIVEGQNLESEVRLLSDDRIIIGSKAWGESFAIFNDDGAVTIYYDGNEKLSTTATGIDVTGVITTDGMTTSADINFGDNDKAIFGADSDLQIYHNGIDSYIDNNSPNHLYIRNGKDDHDVFIQSDDGSGGFATYFLADGSTGEAQLFHYGSQKLNTTSTGVEVTGRSVGGTPTPENDGSFDLSANNDFTCTTTTATEITFTNAEAGQSGNIKFVNGGNHVITADTMVAINADVLSTLSATGTYHLAYYATASSGNDTILVSASAALT
jgi:hypothetical protein